MNKIEETFDEELLKTKEERISRGIGASVGLISGVILSIICLILNRKA